ncbi:CocE/NonD family hydrolase [Herbiconiux sp. CPCC 203407]|uniref:CocE/NonD family hydrolase n=1 Tax=Herbiconiux oxytropis TaxID=2970915 RepID=A0AA42BVJ3_9MICO|nr:CocE/NonD family hydrolase [Herbiconiux oxytropis]MCS5723442.1 CocE/NonD family hydrolase [Herbiconiux oxytropis]MCS5726529.1 CocE/NonD family hydrolase [Herbiconiux oxytropis]
MSAFRRATGWGVAAVLVAVSLSAGPAFAETAEAAPALAPAPVDLAIGVTHAENPSVPEGAAWTEHYFPSSAPSNNGDPVELHADVLRPAGLAADVKTPVIMSIGPYFSHSGMNSDTHPLHTGPSGRFTDLIDGAELMGRGYTFVYVDLRGFGGSTGCTDWLGTGEQADVVSAIEWAAAQPWSTGSVGLYGKSYDGSTGLAGINEQPEALKAVVAQEPAWSGYDYLVTNEVPRTNQVDTPLAYIGIAALPGVDRAYQQDGYDIPADTSRYLENAAYEKTHPECAETLKSGALAIDRASDFWINRDAPSHVDGSTVPLLFTQGLTEQNTKPEGMQRYLSNHAGEQRGWLGPWDHVRGNEVDAEGRLQMGRAGWFDEVTAFYDAHLVEQTTEITTGFVIQDNFGRWRAQDTWGTTAKTAVVPLQPGRYLDTGRGMVDDDGDGGGEPGTNPSPNPLLAVADGEDVDAPTSTDDSLGILSVSHPVRADTRLTGTPAVELRTQGAGNASIQLWDVAPDRANAVTINSTVSKLSADGATRFTMLGTDWTLKAGHRLAVTVGTIDWGYWVPQPSDAEVVVTGGSVSIAVETTTADVATEGARAPYLDQYLRYFTSEKPFPDSPETFTLSAALGSIGTDATTVETGSSFVVLGAGYDPGAPVTVTWRGESLATPTTDASGAFSLTVPVSASAATGTATVTAVAEDGGRSAFDVTVAAVVPTPTPTPPTPTPPSPAPPSPAPVPAGSGSATASLAATGLTTEAVPAIAAGAGLVLLAGLALALLRRRARPAER